MRAEQETAALLCFITLSIAALLVTVSYNDRDDVGRRAGFAIGAFLLAVLALVLACFATGKAASIYRSICRLFCDTSQEVNQLQIIPLLDPPLDVVAPPAPAPAPAPAPLVILRHA